MHFVYLLESHVDSRRLYTRLKNQNRRAQCRTESVHHLRPALEFGRKPCRRRQQKGSGIRAIFEERLGEDVCQTSFLIIAAHFPSSHAKAIPGVPARDQVQLRRKVYTDGFCLATLDSRDEPVCSQIRTTRHSPREVRRGNPGPLRRIFVSRKAPAKNLAARRFRPRGRYAGRTACGAHPGKWNLLGGPDFNGARLRLEEAPSHRGRRSAPARGGLGRARPCARSAYDGVMSACRAVSAGRGG